MRWLIAILACWGILPAVAAPAGPGKIWFDLKVERPADSTSPVVAWPSRADLSGEPSDTPAIDAAWRALAALSTATPDSPETSSLPRLGQSAEDFIENLKVILSAQGFTFADGFDISTEAPPPKIRIGIDYTVFIDHTLAPILPASFEVWARTRLLPPDSPAYRWPIRELMGDRAVQALVQTQRGTSRPPLSLRSVPENFILVILPAEGPWLRPLAETRPDARLFTPIFAVAVTSAEEAIRQQILEKPRTPYNRDTLATALRHSFDSWRLTGEIAFGQELSAVDDAYGQPTTPAWVLRLTDFNPVRRQSVVITDIQLGSAGRQSWAAFLAHQQAAGRTLDTLIAQKKVLEEKLSAALETQHPWPAPHFPTETELAVRTNFLRGQSGVAGVEPKTFRDEVAYAITWYPILTTLEASGTYNSDRGGNVSTRLSVQSRDLSLAAEGFMANRRRGVFADVTTTPKATSLPDNAIVTWGILGDYASESPVRFGTPAEFSLRDEEINAGARWRLEGGHRDETTDLVRARRWKIDAIAGYRRSRLTGDNFNFVQHPDGAAPYGSIELTGEWDHGRKNDAGQIASPDGTLHLELSADASPAYRATAQFARAQFKATEEFQLGAGRWQNSLVRVSASGGSATEETPVAWWFRLGGDERMRGFELGELTGRSFFHTGIEAGVSAGALLATPTQVAAAAAAPPRFDLRRIRLLLGVEHAWIGEPPAFIPAVPALHQGWSYSLTGEYAGVIPGLPGNSKLAIGYGYAPESSHRSGRIFVTLRVPLSTPQTAPLP